MAQTHAKRARIARRARLRRRRFVQFRVNDKELARYRKVAEETGVPLSRWIRHTLECAIEKRGLEFRP